MAVAATNSEEIRRALDANVCKQGCCCLQRHFRYAKSLSVAHPFLAKTVATDDLQGHDEYVYVIRDRP